MASSFSITPGMYRVLQKRTKQNCPTCNLTIPVYPGRYPQHCPMCKSVLNPPVEEKAAEEVDNIAFDRLMQKINYFDLLDSLEGVKVGSKATDGVDCLWFYFSDQVNAEDLRRFVEEIKVHTDAVSVYDPDKDGKSFVVSVVRPHRDDKPATDGEVDFSAPVGGDVDVQ